MRAIRTSTLLKAGQNRMFSYSRPWMGQGFRGAALVVICLGLALSANANAQEMPAQQAVQAQPAAPGCGCDACGTNPCSCAPRLPCGPCGPCGAGYGAAGGYGYGGAYGAGGYAAGAYGAGGYAAPGGVAGPGAADGGSFDAFGASGGAGAAGGGPGAAPYMIGDLLQANRVLRFNYNRVASMGSITAPGFWAVSVDGGAVVNIRNTKVAENNNAIPTDRFAY
jgi:hypothetical protein